MSIIGLHKNYCLTCRHISGQDKYWENGRMKGLRDGGTGRWRDWEMEGLGDGGREEE
jgi:hypothetical protein